MVALYLILIYLLALYDYWIRSGKYLQVYITLIYSEASFNFNIKYSHSLMRIEYYVCLQNNNNNNNNNNKKLISSKIWRVLSLYTTLRHRYRGARELFLEVRARTHIVHLIFTMPSPRHTVTGTWMMLDAFSGRQQNCGTTYTVSAY